MKLKNGIYYFSSLGSKNVLAGFSTKALGSVKHGNKFNKPVLERIADSIGISLKQIIYMDQKHTANVEVVGKSSPQLLSNTDGIITQEKNKVLLAVTADCLPIIFYDPVKGIAGVAHGGYKGILLGIVENMIKKFNQMGSFHKNILIGIGPLIGVCCYNVPKERIEQFKKRFPDLKDYFIKKNSIYFLDLQSVVLQILKQHKVQKKNIELVSPCTSCNNQQFFSFRKDTKKTFGEFATLIRIV